MSGETLVLSKHDKLFSHYKERFEALRFKNVEITDREKDALNMVINEMNPKLLIVGASFYECCTPFMMRRMLRLHPEMNIAAVSLSKYPADLALGFITNGVKSYVNVLEGLDQFYRGLEMIRKGESYISPEVEHRRKIRSNNPPKMANEISERGMEVLRFICNGFYAAEIADVMHISERTIDYHREELYKNLNVRNENELIRVALYLGFVTLDELMFYGGKYELSPKPDKKKNKGRLNVVKNENRKYKTW